MIYSFKIVAFALVLFSVFQARCQFWKNNYEESIQEQAADDIFALPLSAEDFPYIDKYHQAVREKVAGNLSEAKSLFKECIGNYRYQDAVYFGLAEIAKQQKLKTEALEYFIKAHEEDPENLHYIQEVTYLQYEKAQFEEAKDNFAKLTAAQPRNAQWLYGYAQTLMYTRDYEKALEVFNKFQDVMGPVPEVTMTKIDLLEELGKDDLIEEELLILKRSQPQNLEILKMVIGFYEERGEQEKAIKLIKELVESDPENGVAHIILAKYYYEERDFDSYYESCIVVAGSPDVKIQDKVMIVEPLFNFKDFPADKTLKITTGLAESHPQEPRILMLHAESLIDAGKSKEAITFYRQALKFETSDYEIWINTLAVLSAFREYEALSAEGEMAMAYFPALPFVYYMAAEGLIGVGKYDEAISILETGEMYVIEDEQQKAKFKMLMGHAQYAKGNEKKGDDYFQQSLEVLKRPKDRLKLAYIRAQYNREAAENKKIAEEAMNIPDIGGNTYYEAGFILMQNKDYDRAKRYITTGIEELDGYKAELYDLLGDILYKLTDEEAAVKNWKLAKELGSRNKELIKKIEQRKYYAPKYF
jgi:tetratricopeptide (TPR) repeat protein